jgi:cytosine/adenosine deaminase-related metal-dependent hydrolase
MVQHRTICLKGGHVWPGGDAALAEGGILIRGSRIMAVLSPAEAETAAESADEVVDASGLVLMPPFFDCHVHSNSTLLRGTENSLPLELWSYYAINYGRELTDEAVRLSALLTDVEMIRNGIGGYIDHFPQTHRASAALSAHIQSGLRLGFAPFFADMWDEDILAIPIDRSITEKIAPMAPRRLHDIRASYAYLDIEIRQHGAGRITLLAGPNSPQRCSSSLWALWRELQDTYGLCSHTHLLETFPQAKAARGRWPQGLIRALADAGLLHDKLSTAHAIWLDPGERDLLASHGVTVSYNPLSNGMLGSGRKRVREDLDAGLRIALGTDCSNTGGRHDLFEVMRHMLISSRDPGTDFARWVEPADVLNAATTSGARVIGGSTAGLLAKNSAADVLVLDLEAAGMAASTKSLNSIVVHADPRNVHSLMVAGRWLLRNGTITTLDERAVLRDSLRLADDLRAAADDRRKEIKSLHASYAAWQQGVFAHHRCPACGCFSGSLARTYPCHPAGED